jgi:hypothetical protein
MILTFLLGYFLSSKIYLTNRKTTDKTTTNTHSHRAIVVQYVELSSGKILTYYYCQHAKREQPYYNFQVTLVNAGTTFVFELNNSERGL